MLNSSSQKLPWIIGITGLTACILSVIIASLKALPIDLLYISIISIFSSVLLIFIISETRKTYFSKNRYRILLFLSTYVFLITWLGFTKVIPEYNKITAFENHRNALVFKLMSGNKEDEDMWKLKLAKHYLTAPTVMIRNEFFIRYKGVKMMEKLLNEKIGQNLAEEYKHEMFYLAEFAFQSSNETSSIWYKKAYEAGRLDALERFQQRVKENYKDSEPDRFESLALYNQQMKDKYDRM